MGLILSIKDGDSVSEFKLTGKQTLGSSKDASIQLNNKDLDEEHCIFKEKNGIVSLHNLAVDGKTQVESHPLTKGKMYLLNLGDTIKIGNLEIVLKSDEPEGTLPSISIDTEEVEEDEIADETPEEPTDEPPEVAFGIEDKTDPSVPLTEAEEKLDNVGDDSALFHDEEDELSLADFAQSADVLSEAIEEDEEEFDEELDEEELSDEELEMLHAIQEGRQPGVKNQTNIFRRILNKLNPKRVIVDQAEKKDIFQRAKLPSPHLFVRMLIWITNLSITYAFIFTLCPLFGLSDPLYNDLLRPITPKVHEILAGIFSGIDAVNIELCLKFMFTYFMIEILSTIAFGANIGELLAAVRSNDSILMMRAKGVLRVIIGNLTSPLILPLLPSIIKKRTLKEVLSFSSLGYVGNRAARFIAVFAITPMTIVIMILSPLTIDPENITGIVFESTVKPRPANKDQYLRISPLKLIINKKYQKKYTALPITKVDNNGNFTMDLRFIDPEKNQTVTLSAKEASFNLLYALQQIKKYDFAFGYKYPKISGQDQNKDKIVFDEQLVDEVRKLTKNSLMVNPENFGQYILKEGPTITGNILFRQEILKSLNLNNVTVQFLGKLDKTYIKFTPIRPGINNVNTFIPINNLKMYSYSIVYKNKSRVLANTFERLMKVESDKELEEVEELPIFKLVSDIDGIKKDPMVIDRIISFYKENLLTDNEMVKKEYIRSLKSVAKAFSMAIKDPEDPSLKEKLTELNNYSNSLN